MVTPAGNPNRAAAADTRQKTQTFPRRPGATSEQRAGRPAQRRGLAFFKADWEKSENKKKGCFSRGGRRCSERSLEVQLLSGGTFKILCSKVMLVSSQNNSCSSSSHSHLATSHVLLCPFTRLFRCFFTIQSPLLSAPVPLPSLLHSNATRHERRAGSRGGRTLVVGSSSQASPLFFAAPRVSLLKAQHARFFSQSNRLSHN